MKKFIVCDVGKKQTFVFFPELNKHYIISNEDFINLIVPGLSGHDVVIEAAHLMSQEGNSLAQSWTIDQLRQLRSVADLKGIEILCFPQKVTPKARKIASIGLRFSKGFSYHGISLNVDMDLQPFQSINPCGYHGLEVTQIKDFYSNISLEKVKLVVQDQINKSFS